jgi:signal transduction histidine kinase
MERNLESGPAVPESPDPQPRVATLHRGLLGALVGVATVGVVALALFDARRDEASAFSDFAQGVQVTAEALADGLGSGAEGREDLFRSLARFEDQGRVRIYVRVRGSGTLVGLDGKPVPAPIATSADNLENGPSRVEREAAAALGLPERRAAMAVVAPAAGPVDRLVLIVSAASERARENHAEWRLVLSSLTAAGLVLGFGLLALAGARREARLHGDLALAALSRDHDARITRADKLATLGALATGIGHELSSPLGAILGRAEQLEPLVAGNPAGQKSLGVILEQVERMRQTIRGFLGMVRGEAVPLVATPPARLVQDAAELVRYRFEASGVALDVALGAQVPTVACDPRTFGSVLTNLLLNALDASKAGDAVAVSCQERGGKVAFTVEDHGHGIPQELSERVFEPFFTTKRDGKGTGLGLAIATEIVRSHRGTLTLAPRAPGPGTVATVEMPAGGEPS